MHNVVRYVMHSVVLLQQLLRCACCAVLRNVLLANNSIVVQVHALRVIVYCKQVQFVRVLRVLHNAMRCSMHKVVLLRCKRCYSSSIVLRILCCAFAHCAGVKLRVRVQCACKLHVCACHFLYVLRFVLRCKLHVCNVQQLRKRNTYVLQQLLQLRNSKRVVVCLQQYSLLRLRYSKFLHSACFLRCTALLQ